MPRGKRKYSGTVRPATSTMRWKAEPRSPFTVRKPIGGNFGYFTVLTIMTAITIIRTTRPWRSKWRYDSEAWYQSVWLNGYQTAIVIPADGEGMPVNHPGFEPRVSACTLKRARRS